VFQNEVVNLGNERFNETATDIRYAREKIFRRIIEKSPDDASNKSKKKKMNISQPIKQETKTESDLTVKRVEEDRGLATQAAIVRIMKMRQKLNHNNLITAVVEQLQARFTAKVPLIKKQIEILVEKEYIARVDGERDMYEYLA